MNQQTGGIVTRSKMRPLQWGEDVFPGCLVLFLPLSVKIL